MFNKILVILLFLLMSVCTAYGKDASKDLLSNSKYYNLNNNINSINSKIQNNQKALDSIISRFDKHEENIDSLKKIATEAAHNNIISIEERSIQNKERINSINNKLEIYTKYVDSAYKQVDWWLAGLAILLAVFSIVITLLVAGKAKSEYIRSKERIDEVNKRTAELLSKIEKDANDIANTKSTALEDSRKIKEEREALEEANNRNALSANDRTIVAETVRFGVGEVDDDIPSSDKIMSKALKSFNRHEWSDAIKFLEIALNEHPDDVVLLESLSTACRNLANIISRKDKTQARELFLKSITLLEKVCDKHPQNLNPQNNLAVTLFDLSKISTGSERRELMERSILLLRDVIGKNKDYYLPPRNCGQYLLVQSTYLSDIDDKIKNVKDAIAFVEESNRLKENDSYTLSILAACYCEYSKLLKGDDAKKYIAKAAELIEFAERYRANEDEEASVLNAKGYIYIEFSRYLLEKQREGLLRDAYHALMSANQIRPHISDYNLACYYVVIANYDNAHYWLQATLDHSTELCHLIGVDRDFDDIRDAVWFKQLMANYCEVDL